MAPCFVINHPVVPGIDSPRDSSPARPKKKRAKSRPMWVGNWMNSGADFGHPNSKFVLIDNWSLIFFDHNCCMLLNRFFMLPIGCFEKISRRMSVKAPVGSTLVDVAKEREKVWPNWKLLVIWVVCLVYLSLLILRYGYLIVKLMVLIVKLIVIWSILT